MIRPYADRDLDELLDVWYRASLLAHPFLSAEFLEAERVGGTALPTGEVWMARRYFSP